MGRVPESKSEHRLALAAQLVDDIELGRLPPENLFLKASRLARLTSNDGISRWIDCELIGFFSDDKVSRDWMGQTGRYTDSEKGIGYWMTFAQIEAQIAANKLQMQQLQVPSIHFAPASSNPTELVTGFAGFAVTTATAPARAVLAQLSELNVHVSRLSGIRSRVLALLHTFATKTYYELLFSNQQESLFEKQRAIIDTELASSCGDVLKKVPAVYDRLGEGGDSESISHALTTCRRIVDAFADFIYPASADTIAIGDKTLKLTAAHHQNRLNAFVHFHCASASRRKRIRHSLEDLYDRLSVGVHQDVTPEEARFLFLQTYLVIGEILTFRTAEQPAKAGVPTEENDTAGKPKGRVK